MFLVVLTVARALEAEAKQMTEREHRRCNCSMAKTLRGPCLGRH